MRHYGALRVRLGTILKTIRPIDGMDIAESVRFEPGSYLLPRGVRIVRDAVNIDGAGATLIGENQSGRGICVEGRSDCAIRGVSIRDYYHGIHARDCQGLQISDCDISRTSEIASNTIFLDIWLPAEESYGGAVCLINCSDAAIQRSRLEHQMNGILTYGCSRLEVSGNLCNYNSGWGIHLYNTCDSVFESNSCDYCCRFEPREGGPHYGHMGADAAGFLAVMNSSRNKFIRNTARMGGDGFFLAGMSPGFKLCACDDNLFEENDASLSPNIAFEATFSKGNVFRKNIADRCNYGFWCGFSTGFVIEENRILWNRQAGIAVENGTGFVVENNKFQANGHGILLWSREQGPFGATVPDRATCCDWLIRKNDFHSNGKGIRIASNQDHGIRNAQRTAVRPHDNKIVENDIQDNRVGIDLFMADRTEIRANTINRNVESNICDADGCDNVVANNLGAAGAYL
jgi:parallel beta-helix repeat protein